MYVNHVYLAKWLKNSEVLSVILLVIAKCDWQFWVREYNYLPFGTWTLKLIRPSISRQRQHYVFYLEDSKWGQQSPMPKRWAVFPDYRELQDSRPQNLHQESAQLMISSELMKSHQTLRKPPCFLQVNSAVGWCVLGTGYISTISGSD